MVKKIFENLFLEYMKLNIILDKTLSELLTLCKFDIIIYVKIKSVWSREEFLTRDGMCTFHQRIILSTMIKKKRKGESPFCTTQESLR